MEYTRSIQKYVKGEKNMWACCVPVCRAIVYYAHCPRALNQLKKLLLLETLLKKRCECERESLLPEKKYCSKLVEDRNNKKIK